MENKIKWDYADETVMRLLHDDGNGGADVLGEIKATNYGNYHWVRWPSNNVALAHLWFPKEIERGYSRYERDIIGVGWQKDRYSGVHSFVFTDLPPNIIFVTTLAQIITTLDYAFEWILFPTPIEELKYKWLYKEKEFTRGRFPTFKEAVEHVEKHYSALGRQE